MKLLERIVGSKTKIAVLRVLSRNLNWNYSITELSKDVNLNKSLVSKVIEELQNEHVVKVLIKGKTKLCRINAENKIVREIIIKLFENEKKVLDSVIDNLIKQIKPEKNSSILSMILYGSFAKEEFTPRSDIDLMIIVKNKAEIKKIKQMLLKVSEDFMRDDLIVFHDIITKGEFKRLYTQREPVMMDIFKFNKLLYGRDLTEIVK